VKTNKQDRSNFLLALPLAALMLLAPFLASADALEDAGKNLDIPSLVQVLNRDRAQNGLHPLRRSLRLDEAAKGKAQDMVQNGYFAHTSPQGLDPWHWFGEVDYQYLYAGENLALDFSEADAVQKAWMASAKHRENILNANYEEVGYAIAEGTFTNINGLNKTRQGTLIVQLFGKPLPSVLASLGGLGIVQEPIVSPAAEKTNPLSLANIASNRMLGSVIDYRVVEQTNVLDAKFSSTLQAKVYNTTPPIETWPVVSFGLALLLVSAGISTKFV